MKIKVIFAKIKEGIVKFFYNPEWRCINCGKEVFGDQRFCEDCLKILPYNDGAICEHCGRKLNSFQSYCSTCKGILTNLDMARSCFNYAYPINRLIKKAKYNNAKYLLDYFAEQLANLYFQNYFLADYLTFVPMIKKDERKRGYNQSKVLAERLSGIISVPVLDCLIKEQKTKRQATLNRKERMMNLSNAFKVCDKKSVKGKSILIIDDVSTTGSTAEAIAVKLKNAGAEKVQLLSIASVAPYDKY
jgi:competence protein ComFC